MEQIERFLAAMRERNVRASWLATPWVRLLWKAGIPARPPITLGWRRLVIDHGILFGVGMWTFHTLVGSEAWGDAPDGWAFVAAGAGFGVAMAASWRWKASVLGLPPWENESV